jgi:hypothetical protein
MWKNNTFNNSQVELSKHVSETPPSTVLEMASLEMASLEMASKSHLPALGEISHGRGPQHCPGRYFLAECVWKQVVHLFVYGLGSIRVHVIIAR